MSNIEKRTSGRPSTSSSPTPQTGQQRGTDPRNPNTENSNVVIKWLKKLFSLQFLSVLIGVGGLYLAYRTFIREEPGELTLHNYNKHFGKNVRNIIYGFEIDSDSLYIRGARNFPLLANVSHNSLEDVSIIAEMQNNIGFRTTDGYFCTEEKDSVLWGKVNFYVKRERIGFMDPILFPIETLETDENELLFQHIRFAYAYKGMSEDIINMHYFIVGIPKHYRDDNGKIIDAEYAFLKSIRPLLLQSIAEEVTPNQILIIFKDKYVEAPQNINLLKGENIKVKSIKELQ